MGFFSHVVLFTGPTFFFFLQFKNVTCQSGHGLDNVLRRDFVPQNSTRTQVYSILVGPAPHFGDHCSKLSVVIF